MELLAALKRASLLAKKGELVAVIPPYGGLPARVAFARTEKDGTRFWVSWVLDADVVVESPGFVIDGTSLGKALKNKPLPVVYVNRVLGMPNTLTIKHLTAPDSVEPVVPCMHYDTFCPPWPATQLAELPDPAPVLELLHLVHEDQLRPELSYLAFGDGVVVAGDEAQFGKVAYSSPLAGHLVSPHLFQKWPDGPVRFYEDHERLYFEIGDELRTIRAVKPEWTAQDVVLAALGQHVDASMYIAGPKAPLVAALKGRSTAVRRRIALGQSGTSYWIHLDALVPLAGMQGYGNGIWQVVLDGNRLLAALQGTAGDTFCLQCTGGPRAPVRFESGSVTELIYPLI